MRGSMGLNDPNGGGFGVLELECLDVGVDDER